MLGVLPLKHPILYHDHANKHITKFYFIGKQSAGKHVLSVDLTLLSGVTHIYSLFLATVVGTVATTTSTYILLTMDACINLWGCFTVWTKYKEQEWTQCAHFVLNLVLVEFIEFQVPCTYLITFLVAYFGPNATVIGK